MDLEINFNFIIHCSKKKKKYYIVSFKNVCKKHKVSRVPSWDYLQCQITVCAAGPWPQQSEVLSGSPVYCTSPLCSSSSSISFSLLYLPLPARFFTLASLLWRKKEEGKKASLLESRRCPDSRTDRWLFSTPACRVLPGLKWRSNVNFTSRFLVRNTWRSNHPLLFCEQVHGCKEKRWINAFFNPS